jgi:ABC-2 type transport system ATP-binding protein
MTTTGDREAESDAAPASAGAAVDCRAITKRYGRLVAVADLTFSLDPGEILGVLGPNGAGKTTAIRVLTTILEPTEGTFAVGGAPHTRPDQIRRRIGVLPESAGYPERQTGEEYLRYHARLYGQSAGSARTTASTLLERVGLAERRASLIAGYSRGMRQRLGIARALVNDPQVVFLDEPTLGLDPGGQLQVLGLVRELARERGATVLLSTHLLAEVEETCTRVLILSRGRLVADGTVADVARRAAAPRSALLRVPQERVGDAVRVLEAADGWEVTPASGDRQGTIRATLAADAEQVSGDGLRALLSAGVPVLGFELERARLSDAFLAMTEGE